MKALYGTVSIILLVICALLGAYVADVESRASRWNEYIGSAQQLEEVNENLLASQVYSQRLMEAVRALSLENGLLCEREAKMVEVVSQYKEENRRLKQALTEAVNKMKEQRIKMNEMYEQIDRLHYKIEVLEQALDGKESKIKDALNTVNVITTTVSILPAIL